MILAYLCNSNQLKEPFSEDGVDSPKLVKQTLILDNPYGHKNSIPPAIKMRDDKKNCFNKNFITERRRSLL